MGYNHIDLGTKDMEATRAFYEDVLGFKLVRADLVQIGTRGSMKHYFFDCGDGQLLGFMSGEEIEGYPDFDSDINKGLGLSRGVYHFAFNAESEEELVQIKSKLESKGIAVDGVHDHEGWSKSIYFSDPNGLNLEYCFLMRSFTPEDAVPQIRFSVDDFGKPESKKVLDPLVEGS